MNFGPNNAMLARHHTTLPRCDCIGTLRGLYKDSLMCSNPLGFRSKQGIKLPSGYRVLAKPNSPLEQVYTPSTPPLLPLSGKITTTSRFLIIQQRPEPYSPCGCTVFLGGSPCSNYNMVILFISIDRRWLETLAFLQRQATLTALQLLISWNSLSSKLPNSRSSTRSKHREQPYNSNKQVQLRIMA